MTWVSCHDIIDWCTVIVRYILACVIQLNKHDTMSLCCGHTSTHINISPVVSYCDAHILLFQRVLNIPATTVYIFIICHNNWRNGWDTWRNNIFKWLSIFFICHGLGLCIIYHQQICTANESQRCQTSKRINENLKGYSTVTNGQSNCFQTGYMFVTFQVRLLKICPMNS